MRYLKETNPEGRSYKIQVSPGFESAGDTGVYVVPQHCYFMMGDNRDNSLDSRVSPDEGGVGFVPADNLIGRVNRVLFSITPFSNWLDVVTDPADLRVSRLFHAVH